MIKKISYTACVLFLLFAANFGFSYYSDYALNSYNTPIILSPISSYKPTSMNIYSLLQQYKKSPFKFFTEVNEHKKFYDSHGYIYSEFKDNKIVFHNLYGVPLEHRYYSSMGTHVFIKYDALKKRPPSFFDLEIFATDASGNSFLMPHDERARLKQKSIERDNYYKTYNDCLWYKDKTPYVALVVLVIIWLPSIFRYLKSKLDFADLELTISMKYKRK